MKKLVLALCSVSSLAVAAPAFGQAAQADEVNSANDSEAIIVTARGRDEDVQSVPVVVNTVTSETVAKLNLQIFGEIQALLPGLSMKAESNGFGAGAQIRSVSYDVNASAQPSVEFYLNDAPITSTYSLINTTRPREFGINLRFAFGSR
jgi:iron complex outermembrane receptor protein